MSKDSDHLLYPQGSKSSTITIEVEVQPSRAFHELLSVAACYTLRRPLRMHNALLTGGVVLPCKISTIAAHLPLLALIPPAPRRIRSLGQ